MIKTIFALLFTVISSVSFAGGNLKPLFEQKPADTSVTTAPEAIKVIEPSWFAKLPSTSTVLKWTASPTATHYQLQVATDPNFKWLVTNETVVKDTQFNLSNLEKQTQYYWRVFPVKGDNEASYLKGKYAKSMFMTGAN